MARLYVNANVRELSGNTFVEVTAMITSILRRPDRRLTCAALCVITKCLIFFIFVRCTGADRRTFWCPVKVNGHNSVRDN